MRTERRLGEAFVQNSRPMMASLPRPRSNSILVPVAPGVHAAPPVADIRSGERPIAVA